MIVSVWVLSSNCGSAGRRSLVLHQHQKMLLGRIGALDRIEAGRAVLDGIEPVAGNGLAGRQRGALKRLRAQALDRIALDRTDFWH